MKSKKEVKEYLEELEEQMEEYEESLSVEENLRFEMQIETLEWVLK